MHRREGAQEPRCARSEGRCGAVGFYVVVAATAGEGEGTRGPPDRFKQDASSVAQFTPLRQLRPPEVCPLVSHGRLDTGTSALEDTANDDITHATDVLIVGKRVSLRGSGGRILFAVCEPFCALQACARYRHA